MNGSNRQTGLKPIRNAVLIAGPTASGKSALALELARRTGGVVINADSMQVYSVLRQITARPSDADLAQARHLLYGHVHPSQSYSVGQWQRDVGDLIASDLLAGRRAIFAGGTGLYFKALAGGLSEIPEVDPAVREKWRTLEAEEGPQALHRRLVELDPETADELKPGDGQRIVRALEVVESSGRSIRYWQSQPGVSFIDLASAQRVVVDPGRDVTNRRVADRFEQMVDQGALDEVQNLVDLNLSQTLPAMRAIGVAELRQFLSGKLSRSEAIEMSVIATRQYAKRQRTWFRNQFGHGWQRVCPVNSTDLLKLACKLGS